MARKLRLIVDGASGLLGRKIVESAVESFEVFPAHHEKPLYSNSVRLDVTDRTEVSIVFAKIKPDVVIHTASETNVDKCEVARELAWETNVYGTRYVADACQKARAKLIFISTDYVFHGEKGFYDEEDEPNPVNYYGLTKLEGEKHVVKHCEDYAILRTSVLYGWHPLKQNFATWVINKLRQQQEITVVNDHFNTPTLASNQAEMTLEIAARGLQGVFHTSGCERISRCEFALQIAKVFHLDSDLIKPIRMSALKAWVAKRPADSSLDTGKVQKQLATIPLNVSEALGRLREEEPVVSNPF